MDTGKETEAGLLIDQRLERTRKKDVCDKFCATVIWLIASVEKPCDVSVNGDATV